jgi:transcriptional regulator with XRE-family HTH domain
MFETYDLVNFGERLKKIRTCLGITQKQAADNCGVSIDTLRRIEKGRISSYFDTYVHLSKYYKVDLIALLSEYKKDDSALTLYNKIEIAIMNESKEELIQIYTSLEKFKNNIEPIAYKQLEYLLPVLIDYQENRRTNAKRNSVLIKKCIQLSIKDFSLETFQNERYNMFEMRLLLCLAATLSDINEYEISIKILTYLLDSYDTSIYASQVDIMLYIKTLALLSYIHFNRDDFESSLKYANEGIAFCKEKQCMYTLNLLLARKGAAMYHLGMNDYHQHFDSAIRLYEIKGEYQIAEKWLEIIKTRYTKI